MRKFLPLLLLIFVASVYLLMTSGQKPSVQATPRTSVAPECLPFYEKHGGASFFGSPLTPRQEVSGGVVQTFTNARLFCTSQQAAFPLPLGTVLVHEDPQPPTEAASIFKAWIEAHGGLTLFGPPLTDLQYNEAQKRWEQHFRNLGVALPDGAQTPILLPYGQLVWEAEKTTVGNAIPSTATLIYPDPFYLLFQQIGGQEILGPALTAPYLNRETGAYEVVFRYGVVGLRPQDGYAKASLLPVVRDYGTLLGVHPEPLVTPDPDPSLRFFHIAEGKGHNIPGPFFEFLEDHGGIGILCGQPITERAWYDSNQTQIVQWCTQIGLLWPNAQGDVSLVPFGERYQNLVTKRVSHLPQNDAATYTWHVTAPNQVRVKQPLDVQVRLTDAQGNPLSQASIILVPFGRQPPQIATTNARGEAWFSLSTQEVAMVGIQIYRLCLWQEGQGVVACRPQQVLVMP